MERALLDLLSTHTSLALAASDADGTLSLMTPALEEMLGHAYQPMAEADLAARFHLYYADGCTPLRTEDMPIARARAGEQVIDAVVTARPDETGDRLIYLRCNATPLRDGERHIRGALALVQDITEEWRIRAREAELRERLVVTLNHEVRTPVTKLLGHAELLQEVSELMPDWAQRSLAAVLKASLELADLSQTITQLVDLEAAADITPAHCDLVPAVRTIIDRHAHNCVEQGIRVDLISAARVTATVDLVAVTRAVNELVANAVTYAPAGTRIDIELRADRSCVLVSVTDQGVGIPESEHTRLLQPFERGDHPDQPVNSKGLGLAYARAIAVAHGGDLQLMPNRPNGLVAEWRADRFGRRATFAPQNAFPKPA